jgi:predicted RNase H-like HicB family nuclease
MKVLIIVEESGTGYSNYAPDWPCCIDTGTTRAEVEK